MSGVTQENVTRLRFVGLPTAVLTVRTAVTGTPPATADVLERPGFV